MSSKQVPKKFAPPARESLDAQVEVSPGKEKHDDDFPATSTTPSTGTATSAGTSKNLNHSGVQPGPTARASSSRGPGGGVLAGTTTSSAKDAKDNNRRRLLNLISDIKLKLSQVEGFSGEQMPLTQFVICGGQSAGKSRLIEALAGASFNFVCGTLGSRRPTVVDFRCDKTLEKEGPRWYFSRSARSQRASVEAAASGRNSTGPSTGWIRLQLPEMQSRIAAAHEELGNDVSSDPVYVRLESPDCVEMQVVDLPGFREFSDNAEKQVLADKIDRLVTGFMTDQRSIMLCVEPAGDAANLKTLGRCKKVDPHFERTILIRTKLDKFYPDLSPLNVSTWFEGFGDLPKAMPKFALSLPFWPEDGSPSKRPDFLKLRTQSCERDLSTCIEELGLKPELHRYCGFENMAHSLENIIEKRFSSEITGILDLLEQREQEVDEARAVLARELQTSNSDDFLKIIRGTGATYARALCDIMHGSLHSHVGRMTLAEELIQFEKWSKLQGNVPSEYDCIPSDDFADLNEYIDYLGSTGRCPGFAAEINGGAQFMRLLYEIEVYFRFLDIQHNVTEREIIQSRGVGTTEIAWIDSIVKLMRMHGPMRTKRATNYVAERLKWFFGLQKEAVLEFMLGVKNSCDGHLYSKLLFEKAQLIDGNPTVKKLIFDRYDAAVERHSTMFHSLVTRTIDSMLQKPSVMLKGSSMPGISKEDDLGDMMIPTKADTIHRIRREFSDRGKLDMYLKHLVASIPDNQLAGSEVVEKVTSILVTTFAFVRSFMADELELFAVSFYQLPMLRRLEADMHEIVLDEESRTQAALRKDELEREMKNLDNTLVTLRECILKIKTFRRCCV
ncbi:unnamed protein product [Amoebophrya sp. A120]|nr:unnamed protein product [Amoebophrya sp. A120]|eukprot:GSA120T00001279001.1